MGELQQKAGYGLVIALSITSMIGTGIFFGPAIAASWAGPASIIAWAILSLITLYVGACFSELASMFPDVGGVYAFAKQAYGRFLSFIIGWITWLVSTITAAVIIAAAINMLSLVVPSLWSNPTLGLLVAIVLILLLNFVAFIGIEASTAIMIFFAIVTVGILVVILGSTAVHFEPSNFTPFFTSSPIFIFVALFFILETFFGWESPTFMGSETKNPEKVIPNSIMITTISVAIISILFAGAMLGFVPSETLQSWDSPVVNISYLLFGETGSIIIIYGIVLALIGSAASAIVSSPRLILALAKDRLFIEQLSVIHPKTKTPHRAIIFQTIVSILVVYAAFGDYESLLSLLVPLALVMYISVIMTVPLLRKKFPDMKRKFRAPYPLLGTTFVSLFFIGVIIMWLNYEPNAWPLFKRILSFIAFGIPIYLLLNMYYNPDILFKTVNSTARLNQLLEGIILPKAVRQDILKMFGDLRGKKVLEFGGGVGTLTLPLAEKVGSEGCIYTTDLSPNNLKILNSRMLKKGHQHVTAIHDEHLISRVHPDIPAVDVIFSVGNLSYIQDLRKVLRDMHALLPENGRICFVEYVDYFFGIIPNQPWLDKEDELKKLFREVGFSIHIRKQGGAFWKYLYIYGIKSEHDVPVI